MKLIKSAILIILLLMAVQVQAWAVTYYLSPSGGNFGNASTWASTSGGSDSVGVPNSTVDVVCDPNSGSAVLTVNVTSACKSLDMTEFVGSFILNNKIYIENTIIFSPNATYSSHNYDTCYFYGGFNIYSNGAVVNCTIGALNSAVILEDNLNLGMGNGYFGANTGSIITNNHNIICGKIYHATTNSAVIKLGSSTVTCTSLDLSGTNLTFNYDTSTVIVNQSATGAMAFSPGTAQFYNLTLNGHASTGCYKAFSVDMTVNNALTIAGNSSTNKFALKSSDTTVRTITAPSVTLSNIDYFQNIKGAGDGWIGKVPFFNSSNSWNTSSKYSGILR